MAMLQLGGPRIEMKTGRRDSKESYANFVAESLPNHNDSIILVLSRFQSIGLDVEGIVALLGMAFFLFSWCFIFYLILAIAQTLWLVIRPEPSGWL